MLKITLLSSLLLLIANESNLSKKQAIYSYGRINIKSQPVDSVFASLDSLNISYQTRGNCYAYSSQKNATASNGEAHSNNTALPTNSNFTQGALYLYLNEKEITNYYNKNLGHKLYLVNTTSEAVIFSAQDSRLSIVAQALNKEGEWQAISYLPSSWCGNSYHKITLDKDEYWQFNTPVYTGNFKTKLRYILFRGGNKDAIISNEIDALINLEQFDKESKEGHTPRGIMDPYDD